MPCDRQKSPYSSFTPSCGRHAVSPRESSVIAAASRAGIRPGRPSRQDTTSRPSNNHTCSAETMRYRPGHPQWSPRRKHADVSLIVGPSGLPGTACSLHGTSRDLSTFRFHWSRPDILPTVPRRSQLLWPMKWGNLPSITERNAPLPSAPGRTLHRSRPLLWHFAPLPTTFPSDMSDTFGRGRCKDKELLVCSKA
jgi:hypothetical protein